MSWRDKKRHDDTLTHERTGRYDGEHDRDHDGVDDRLESDRRGGAYAATRGDDHEARERFGGANIGAGFFGWLVAVGMTIILTGIVGALATAVGDSANVTQSEAERDAGTIGIVAAAVLLAIMLIAYYTGGYVAGRMSRFDGGRQGLAVWVIGLLVTALAVGVGLLWGAEYNIFDRIDVPRLPLPTQQLQLGGIIAAVAVILGTLLAATAGGKVGRRYHDRVDRAAFR